MTSVPSYGPGNGLFYLWHLQAIGLVGMDQNSADFEEPLEHWKDSLNPEFGARVAIIDNGCTSLAHPNFGESKIADRIEFAGYHTGAVYERHLSWGGVQAFKDIKLDLERLVLDHSNISAGLKHTLVALCKGDVCAHSYLDVQDPTIRFSAHGTSTAGIVAAGVATAETTTDGGGSSATSGGTAQPDPFPTKIDYWGVNPVATVIPINTVYSADYSPVIMALLYAVAKKADVILMPRSVHDLTSNMDEVKLLESDDPRASRILLQGRRTAERGLFEEILEKVSEEIPVVVAAGNDGCSDAVYPASLKFRRSEAGQRPMTSLFVAGAGTAHGSLASYSSGKDKDGIFLMPSDDGQIINSHFFRPDEQDWRNRNLATEFIRSQLEEGDPFAHTPYAVLAIDIPGQFGYSAQNGENTDYSDIHGDAKRGRIYAENGEKDQLTREAAYRSLYAMFGGTSAASAILAGILSLCQNRFKIKENDKNARMSGTELVKKVLDAGKTGFKSVVPSHAGSQHKPPLERINIEELFESLPVN